MPKDNEVDEKVMPVAWIVTNGGESCEPWLEYEQSEVDALPSVCIAEPLYSAATVAELRAEVVKERERAEKFMWQVRDACARAEAAERRVGELEKLQGELSALEQFLRMASEPVGQECCGQGRYECCGNPIPVFAQPNEVFQAMSDRHAEILTSLAAHTGADPT